MSELHPHLARLHDALRAEEHAERDEHLRLDELPLADQVVAGHSWPMLRITDVSPAGARSRVRVIPSRGVVLHDGIGAGDPAWVERRGLRHAATVDFVDERVAELLVERADGERPEEDTSVVVRRRHDPTTFVRFRKALELADAHRSPLKRMLFEPERTSLVVGTATLDGLNPAQQRAAFHALRAPEIAAIWGPPGTGKTRLLAKLLAEMVREGDRPWALADSNAAVDHLALRALAEGLDVVRLGATSRIGAALGEARLDTKIRRSLLGPALETLDRDISRAWGTPAAPRLIRERNELWERAKDEVLARAQVIATTFGTLARVAPGLPPAETAVVDEATQAIEPAVWVAVPFVQRLVIAGDPAQLGPVIKVPGSPLHQSLLERWVASGADLPMLEEQHRMVPVLRELVAGVYGPRYVDAVAVRDLVPFLEPAALWIDTAGAGGEQCDLATMSLYDPLEVDVAAIAVQRLRAAGVASAEIGVIAPYTAQVARLRSHPDLAQVEVATVNAFQGREKDAIVVTFVRSNEMQELGFVADERRLTVAVTRARRQLVLIGDSATLTASPRFRAMLDHLSERGAVQSVWEEPWSAAVVSR